jgi:hypothetical protein
MRVPIVSVFLAGGMLALGACSTTAQPEVMTMAERAAQCRGSAELTPTGRSTGNPRHDYSCVGRHDQRSARESGAGAGGGLSTAVDRSLRRGY